MFRVERSYPEPDSLKKEKQKKSGKSNCKDVLIQLQKDFFNKCYLCEEKDISGINVEHFKPHKGNKDLKFKWENLFLGCPHCNNTKLAKYENILDCTDKSIDVVNSLIYEFSNFPKPKVKITAIDNDQTTINTVDLLNVIYEGNTPNKKLESDNIRKKIMDELKIFNSLLINYEKNKGNIKEITDMVSKKSAFSAFKRWLIKYHNKNNYNQHYN